MHIKPPNILIEHMSANLIQSKSALKRIIHLHLPLNAVFSFLNWFCDLLLVPDGADNGLIL